MLNATSHSMPPALHPTSESRAHPGVSIDGIKVRSQSKTQTRRRAQLNSSDKNGKARVTSWVGHDGQFPQLGSQAVPTFLKCYLFIRQSFDQNVYFKTPLSIIEKCKSSMHHFRQQFGVCYLEKVVVNYCNKNDKYIKLLYI